MESCAKHPHEMGVAICRRCGGAWCSDCLVYAFGAKKPPFCMSCAMVAGGVRSSGAMPAMPRSEMRSRMRATRVEGKAAAKAAKQLAKRGPLEPVSDQVATGETDWSTPWWEDRQPTLAD